MTPTRSLEGAIRDGFRDHGITDEVIGDQVDEIHSLEGEDGIHPTYVNDLRERALAKMVELFGGVWPGHDQKTDKNARRRKRWTSDRS